MDDYINKRDILILFIFTFIFGPATFFLVPRLFINISKKNIKKMKDQKYRNKHTKEIKTYEAKRNKIRFRFTYFTLEYEVSSKQNILQTLQDLVKKNLKKCKNWWQVDNSPKKSQTQVFFF